MSSLSFPRIPPESLLASPHPAAGRRNNSSTARQLSVAHYRRLTKPQPRYLAEIRPSFAPCVIALSLAVLTALVVSV